MNRIPLQQPVVILADGAFPTHHRLLDILRNAGTLICCDGAANHLMEFSRKPDKIIGDLDSLSAEAREAFRDRLVELPSQQCNDLEKALRWVADQGVKEVVVLGATGLRDDHTLGNLLMLWTNFGMEVTVLTDTGQFNVVHHARAFRSFEGQEVSLFPESNQVRITTAGLAFSLTDASLSRPHKGTSNRCVGSSFSIEVSGGAALVYQSYPPGD